MADTEHLAIKEGKMAGIEKSYEGMTFGEYLKAMRQKCEKKPSLRATAAAIGISPQFYSEVEKGYKSAFIKERLDKLVIFLELDSEETNILFNKAAESKTYNGVAQDFSDYITEKEYVAKALRVAKDLDVGEEEWLKFISDIQNRED